MMDEIEKIRRDRYNQLVFKIIPEAYMVGGFIRDIFLRKESKDRDYAVKIDPEKAVERLRNYIGGTMVKLKDGLTVRLAQRDRVTLDFTHYEKDIKEDIMRRDFTFNAITFSKKSGLFDPTDGLNDLKEGRVRMIDEKNLIADPVRIIRAYRFVGELNGFIEDDTRMSARKYKGLIGNYPSERITLEFFKMIQSCTPIKALKYAIDDSVFKEVIPLKNKQLENVFQKLAKVYQKLKGLPEDFLYLINSEISQGITFQGLIFLDILFMDQDIDISKLSLSRKLKNRVLKYKNVCYQRFDKWTDDSKLYDYFERFGISLFEILLIKGRVDLFQKARRFIKITGHPLINGDEIKGILAVREGPFIGEKLNEIKKAHFMGLIKNKEDAIRYLRKSGP